VREEREDELFYQVKSGVLADRLGARAGDLWNTEHVISVVIAGEERRDDRMTRASKHIPTATRDVTRILMHHGAAGRWKP
jgi:hypothetical protein